MKTIEYSSAGESIKDCETYNRVKQFLASDKDRIIVSTDNFILEARVFVFKGKFSHSELNFWFRGEEIRIDVTGQLSNYPPGFCDHSEKLLDVLLEKPYSWKD